jgi:hypothetical protein
MHNIVSGISIFFFASCIHQYDNSNELRDAFNNGQIKKATLYLFIRWDALNLQTFILIKGGINNCA